MLTPGRTMVAMKSCSGLFVEAVALTPFVLAGNTLLRPLVSYINRRPIDEKNLEALYIVHVVTSHENVASARPAAHAAGSSELPDPRDRHSHRKRRLR
jgi:uncharacterized membrane protein YhiD involved in acid resistance